MKTTLIHFLYLTIFRAADGGALTLNIILKYVCHLCLCGPNCTWKPESIKVVEPNNFLMYMMHDVVIQSAPCKGVCSRHNLYVFLC